MMSHISLGKKQRIGAALFVVLLAVLLGDSAMVQDAFNTLYETNVSNELSHIADMETSSNESNAEVVIPEIAEGVWYILRVVDGDTVIAVDHMKKEFRVRLLGVDTPESVHPSQPVECFGVEASEYLKRLLQGKMVQFEQDASQGLVDKYDRTLAYLFLEDGTFINEKIIRDGYAHEYTYTAGVPYVHQALFIEAERDAKLQSRGLWAPGVCVA